MVRYWHRHWLGAPTTVIKINGFEEEDHILCRYHITYYIMYYKLSALVDTVCNNYINRVTINDNVSCSYSGSKINLFRITWESATNYQIQKKM